MRHMSLIAAVLISGCSQQHAQDITNQYFRDLEFIMTHIPSHFEPNDTRRQNINLTAQCYTVPFDFNGTHYELLFEDVLNTGYTQHHAYKENPAAVLMSPDTLRLYRNDSHTDLTLGQRIPTMGVLRTALGDDTVSVEYRTAVAHLASQFKKTL
ncbi:hypothetical protein H6504_00760 [Candidatus Woesearchaeota archaeon]|nr:hypothetical protein [Candidatus Woesearchaeota archaeon]